VDTRGKAGSARAKQKDQRTSTRGGGGGFKKQQAEKTLKEERNENLFNRASMGKKTFGAKYVQLMMLRAEKGQSKIWLSQQSDVEAAMLTLPMPEKDRYTKRILEGSDAKRKT